MCNFTNATLEAGLRSWAVGSLRYEKKLVPCVLTGTRWLELGFIGVGSHWETMEVQWQIFLETAKLSILSFLYTKSRSHCQLCILVLKVPIGG